MTEPTSFLSSKREYIMRILHEVGAHNELAESEDLSHRARHLERWQKISKKLKRIGVSNTFEAAELLEKLERNESATTSKKPHNLPIISKYE